ncbi:glycosyltransferase family 4 protein [Ciceribacter selenitireducens]|uniref:glycosyltransferase family 4 protein n=1 Tax=Ciceribacter selenitireducens TaxID=448181 RepID=UPI0011C01F5D|nr:glycosyltransferase family 4 protein [Ciceribacter selenitireducens]
MSEVNVVYHHYPHYRRPIMAELVANGRHRYRFWGSTEPIAGIVAFAGDDEVPVIPLRFRVWRGLWLLKGYWPALLDRRCDVLIVLANPNMPASWLMAMVGRATGKKVFFWAHGWLKREGFVKRRLRNLYFRLAHGMLVYGERSREIGISLGYPADRITVIYNSLDFDRARRLVAQAEGAPSVERPQDLFIDRDRPLVICTARLTRHCRFDLLLEAAARLKREGSPVNTLLVGDGAERRSLETLARQLGVEAHFYGACYDEEVLARLIYFADLTVSPGKIGLTVIHSLSYGTPAITHGDLDAQMPEVEAIVPGSTGAFFRRGDAGDLADVMRAWLTSGKIRSEVRRACYDMIAGNWNPRRQRMLIEEAIDRVTAFRGSGDA